jgi:stage II sporulation protein M
MRLSLLLVGGLFLACVLFGGSQAKVYSLPAQLLQLADFSDGSLEGFDAAAIFSSSGALQIWFHNLRAMILAFLLGLFSFGVLGVVVLMIPPVLVGYFMATGAAAGLPAWKFLAAFILPHGIFEIPAILLAGAAILKLGADLATPAGEAGFGEVILRSAANWAKITAGLILPLLLAAAVMEALVTPHVVNWFLG